MKAKRLLFLVMAICLASGVKAQIYNSEVLFYVEEDSKLSDPQTRLSIYRFKNGKRQYYNGEDHLKDVCDNLKSNINYYETHSAKWSDGLGDEFDSKMSNAKWIVYSYHFDACYDYNTGIMEFPSHTCYSAFANDFSKYMSWYEPEFDYRGGAHAGARITYKRLTKSELLKLSFTGARDFLQ